MRSYVKRKVWSTQTEKLHVIQSNMSHLCNSVFSGDLVFAFSVFYCLLLPESRKHPLLQLVSVTVVVGVYLQGLQEATVRTFHTQKQTYMRHKSEIFALLTVFLVLQEGSCKDEGLLVGLANAHLINLPVENSSQLLS